MGNTCLYGATGGKLFACGRAGERFGVRNSGCHAVVEGTGDHTCEYMTGGIVTVLGNVGVNFGAGMTGGFAYVLDEANDLDMRLNKESIEMLSIDMTVLLFTKSTYEALSVSTSKKLAVFVHKKY